MRKNVLTDSSSREQPRQGAVWPGSPVWLLGLVKKYSDRFRRQRIAETRSGMTRESSLAAGAILACLILFRRLRIAEPGSCMTRESSLVAGACRKLVWFYLGAWEQPSQGAVWPGSPVWLLGHVHVLSLLLLLLLPHRHVMPNHSQNKMISLMEKN
jgi:hypothetical protein